MDKLYSVQVLPRKRISATALTVPHYYTQSQWSLDTSSSRPFWPRLAMLSKSIRFDPFLAHSTSSRNSFLLHIRQFQHTTRKEIHGQLLHTAFSQRTVLADNASQRICSVSGWIFPSVAMFESESCARVKKIYLAPCARLLRLDESSSYPRRKEIYIYIYIYVQLTLSGKHFVLEKNTHISNSPALTFIFVSTT